MQNIKNNLLDNIAKLAIGIMGTTETIRQEKNSIINNGVDYIASKLNLVSREEFNIVSKLVKNADKKCEKLEIELKEIKSTINKSKK